MSILRYILYLIPIPFLCGNRLKLQISIFCVQILSFYIYIYYNQAKLNMKKHGFINTVILLITISLFGSPEIFLCKSELFDFCNTMPCRWRKVASVEIISLSGVHHLFYDFVFVIVSYTLSFFFRNFKPKRIANNFLNQKTGVLFSKLSERNA